MEDTHESKMHALMLNALRKYVFISVQVGSVTLRSVPSETVNAMLQGDNARIFYQVFTHSSYDIGGSYERLETAGDSTANLIVLDQIAELYPQLDEEQLTNMLSHYKSNKVFGALLRKAIPDINTIILTNDPIDNDMHADIFEALMRAIYVTANRAGARGIGFACAQNVYYIMARDFKPDIKYAAGNPKSRIIEIFGAGNVTEYPPEGGDFKSGNTLEVTVSKAGIDEVNRVMGTRTSDRITVDNLQVSAKGIDRPEARDAAYEQLLHVLENDYNISPAEFAEKKRINTIKSSPYGAEVLRLEQERREEIYFQKKMKKGYHEWRLIAQSKDEDKKRRIIARITVTKNVSGYEAKEQLIQLYIASKR